MDVAHGCLQNYLMWLVLWSLLVDNLQLCLIWAFVKDVSHQLVVRSLLRKLFGEDVKSNLFESSCIDGWVCSSLLSFCSGRSCGISHRFSLVNRKLEKPFRLSLPEDFDKCLFGDVVVLNAQQ